MSDISTLTAARYGKDKVRVLRVVRDGSWHNIVEYYVTTLLEGDIDVSYTAADNSVIVATDSIKNITYYLAKVSPHVLNPERFALHIGTHILSKYPHIHKAFVTVQQVRWTRIPVDGTDVGHAHSFFRDGDDKRFVKVEVDATKGKDKLTATITSGITDLLILKSSGSSFTNFIRDGYTTLQEVDDRIFSTSIDLSYTFSAISIPSPSDEAKLEFVIPQGSGGDVWDEGVSSRARKITLDVFAADSSASVQATLYKMAQQIVTEHAGIDSVSYSLPNKHYIAVDMKYIGLDNTTPSQAEVFMPIETPSGLISATVSRKK
ncbi:uricase [Pleurotus eryngii]|uniref:Uricase n=1 Tax=Pleurotus eryngii TaxID=5323 RepID=A0A9P5ZYY6_PLEER|nr:uricase [Pleurotus eryngii]